MVTSSCIPKRCKSCNSCCFNKYEFISYTLWNIVRYIALALLIWDLNIENVNKIHTMKGYKEHCCDCYYISQNTTYYNDVAVRYDWSYCNPKCANCAYCKKRFNNSAEIAFKYHDNQTPSCPLDTYNNTYSSTFNWNWHKETECPSNLDITTRRFWAKSFNFYGIAVWPVCGFYIVLLCIILGITIGKYCPCKCDSCELFSKPHFMNKMVIFIWTYNAFISVLCSYLLFKPYEYQDQEIVVEYDDASKRVTCQVASIGIPFQDLLNIVVWATLALIVIHILYTVFKSIAFCYKQCACCKTIFCMGCVIEWCRLCCRRNCCARRCLKRRSTMRHHVQNTQMIKMHEYGDKSFLLPVQDDDNDKGWCYWKWICIKCGLPKCVLPILKYVSWRWLCPLSIFAFFCCAAFSMIRMMIAVNNYPNLYWHHKEEDVKLISVAVLLGTSFFDRVRSWWLLYTGCKKCCKRSSAKKYCKKCCSSATQDHQEEKYDNIGE